VKSNLLAYHSGVFDFLNVDIGLQQIRGGFKSWTKELATDQSKSAIIPVDFLDRRVE
jgi:hypothetical protein